MCAAVAVNTLNTNAITLRDVEDSRDQSVAAAGTVAFLGLLTMLLEGVIVLLHFCTKGVLNPYVVGLSQDSFNYILLSADIVAKSSYIYTLKATCIILLACDIVTKH